MMAERRAPSLLTGCLSVALVATLIVSVQGGCDYYKNCAACVADTTCGWCGNDPYHAGGYGFTLQGDHTEGNPYSTDAIMVGGIGKVRLQSAFGTMVEGLNTVFTKQFRGAASFNEDDSQDGRNPYKLRVEVDDVWQELDVYRVYSDTLLELDPDTPPTVDFLTYQKFTLGTPRGTGGLSFGPTSSEVVMPNSATKEQLTIVCSTGNNLPTSPNPASNSGCKFTKELKPGYLLVIDKFSPPKVRVITAIISDTELTVDADFFISNTTSDETFLPHSGDELASSDSTQWTYVSCPPRVGKWATGLGTIESHIDQSTNFKDSGDMIDGEIARCSGACTLKRHRIVGRGTRFETQFGKETTWAEKESGGYYGVGPWVSVQINGDWETQLVKTLGTSGTYAEYIMVLENSFSEPLLKNTHFHWYTMLMKGYGNIRSYGKRVVSNKWANLEFSSMSGTGRTEGFYGNTRFLTQLRPGFTITACGQTRMVNSIQSDVELTVDRPFTLGNREFFPAAFSQAKNHDLYVRGLTRLLPLWPRGVTIQIIVTKADQVNSNPKYKYHVWWKTFKHTDDGDGNSADDICTTYDIQNQVDCGIEMQWNSWKQLEDKELQKPFGVYIKWKKCAMGAGSGAGCDTVMFAREDEWKIHVADIENCEYWVSTEGERFINDDNANPPVCYNYGKCLPITSDATTVAEAQKRPQITAPGLVTWDKATFYLTATQDPYDANRNAKFTTDVEPGDIIRILVDGQDATKWKDIRVIRIVSDTKLVSDYDEAFSGSWNYRILKCAAGRRYGNNHDFTTGTIPRNPQNKRGLVADDEPLAYLPHPEHTFYHTWSYKYCEVDPGCCGFRVSSIVDPQQFAYYFIKPDHSNYNMRVAVHTVNDNLDLYTRRDDDGSGRPDTTNYHLTSVRESVPWAIDEDEYDFACLTSYLMASVMGGDSAVGAAPEAYHYALGHYEQNDYRPNCEKWTVGIMGDNRYPQTVGASEYSARFYLEFNFPDFECQDSGLTAEDRFGFSGMSHKNKCIQNDLRFVRDADVVLNEGDSPRWVVRLTETKKREGGAFVRWRDAGGASYPNAQRSGALWWYRKVHIWDGFETNFVFQITNPSQCGGDDKICDGADGFAFVITNDERQEDGDFNSNSGWDCDTALTCDITDGLIGCPADGLGYSNSKKSNTVNYFGEWQECTDGLRKSLAVEFDTFYNVERRDPKQGKQHWWINATEYISYNDNHLGVFMTTEPKYAHQPWGASQPELHALHSDDENGAHFGSTPSVPTMADFQEHTVKIRYTRGFTTEKQGSGKVSTTDIVSADSDRRRLKGNQLTRFKTELRTGFEFGYASRVKANVKIKLNRDITCEDPETAGTFYTCRQAPPVATTGFGDDGEMCRVIKVIDDDEANMEDTETSGATAEETEVRITYMPAFNPKQDTYIDYNIIKEFPGELQVFIDDMDRYVFQVAVEDRDMAKILDTDGNAYVGFTASTGSKGFAKVGYDPEEVHETHDILAWNFCNNPGCVPY
mmetsp:Transcript_10688/g.12494  ORF Transcript_10688/g.12494 Transcript_10688/m.12494 type:complete len:1506 (+) Transcript_10688:181-4698(+)|eukprot:CAMPEP_0197854672 /NCGR_PEP_ID=MMETSP1438-20131217/25099_1 /TAXON_ID=1461541 /ORGANISM="Pterosperma sp., Strain CCMP1384" /LENGTH=1505 /DNA_ID=CAMNT_0043469497 /DNA_START=178 /DNA_END=4695 /DNA_ORIENTATION=+